MKSEFLTAIFDANTIMNELSQYRPHGCGSIKLESGDGYYQLNIKGAWQVPSTHLRLNLLTNELENLNQFNEIMLEIRTMTLGIRDTVQSTFEQYQ